MSVIGPKRTFDDRGSMSAIVGEKRTSTERPVRQPLEVLSSVQMYFTFG
jgi:hypothetical protein